MKAGRFLEVKEVDKLYSNRNMTDILLPRVLSPRKLIWICKFDWGHWWISATFFVSHIVNQPVISTISSLPVSSTGMLWFPFGVSDGLHISISGRGRLKVRRIPRSSSLSQNLFTFPQRSAVTVGGAARKLTPRATRLEPSYQLRCGKTRTSESGNWQTKSPTFVDWGANKINPVSSKAMTAFSGGDDL